MAWNRSLLPAPESGRGSGSSDPEPEPVIPTSHIPGAQTPSSPVSAWKPLVIHMAAGS